VPILNRQGIGTISDPAQHKLASWANAVCGPLGSLRRVKLKQWTLGYP